MRDADAACIAAIFERDAAGDRDRILAEAAMDRELALSAFRRRCDLVDDREQWIGWTSRDQWRLADCRTWFDKEIEGVVVDCERRDLSAVVPRQIFPVPTRAVLWSKKVTFVADDVAFNALDACRNDPCGEIVDPFDVIAAVETCSNRRIATTVNDQITMNDTGSIRARDRVNGSRETIVGRQTIERSSDRVKLHVRRRAQELPRILLEQHATVIERNHLDTHHRRRQLRFREH